MLIGVPKEQKTAETRVGMTPGGVEMLVDRGHEVLVETGAGTGTGISNTEYEEAGATIVEDAATAWETDLVVKVKEPQASEYEYLEDQIVFTYFHLAAFEELTHELLETDVTAIAYETVEEPDGTMPLLRPMSQVAGRMAPLMGVKYLSRQDGGRGVLPTGLPGVEPATVSVIGGGTVGANAARIAANLGSEVTILEIDQNRLVTLESDLPINVSTQYSTPSSVREAVVESDVVIGAVLVTGKEAPTVVEEADVAAMQDGSVIVDVAVDQGGCVATTHPTTHPDPVFEKHGVVHYAVANMPSAYPLTATKGLTNATISYVIDIAEKGWKTALEEDDALRRGLNVAAGSVTYEPVADEFDLEYVPFEDL